MNDPKSSDQGQGAAGQADAGEAATPSSYPDPRSLKTIIEYHRDHARYKLLEFLAGMEREDLTRPVDCLAGGSIRDKLVHMIDTERFWISVLQNRSNIPLKTDDYADLDSLIPVFREATDRTVSVLLTADRDWFTRSELFGMPGGRAPLRLVPGLVVLHVLTHEFHHKGQICAAARILGYAPPDLDLI